ncbi:MAG: BMP family ABC transporter substrate-binding protein [Spirochaetales bacterium]|nr:BMP family ABC transporter substrate-binding protein [Spirochaetales bacterium]
MKIFNSRVVLTLFMIMLSFFIFTGCSGKEDELTRGETESLNAVDGISKIVKDGPKSFNLAVVVPGVTAGSPIYEQLVSGSELAIKENAHSSMKVFELDYNQAQWNEKITSIVATGVYDVIITSNPSMPYVCMDISLQFPEQKFIFVDAFVSGNPNMTSYLYNQVEQSYMLGHLAGLITKSDMTGANSDKKIGIIVAQEYPALNKMMVPGFENGAKSVDPDIELDYRVLGNWYDAAKAGELARSMIDSGVDVIGVICGGAATGVFDVCRERGKYIMFWDENGYAKAPGVIAGSGALMQEMLVYEKVSDAVNGKIEWGTSTKLHTKDGYVKFISDDPDYINTVPEEIRVKQQVLVDKITQGELILEIPEL